MWGTGATCDVSRCKAIDRREHDLLVRACRKSRDLVPRQAVLVPLRF
jgi:hypothetical protein